MPCITFSNYPARETALKVVHLHHDSPGGSNANNNLQADGAQTSQIKQGFNLNKSDKIKFFILP